MADRVWLEVATEGERRAMPLEKFLEENEGSPAWSASALALAESEIGARLHDNRGITVTRVAPPTRTPSRVVKLELPWSFDGSRAVTVKIHRDTGTITFRPKGRRRVTHVALAELLEVVASREAKKAALERRKARRSRRG